MQQSGTIDGLDSVIMMKDDSHSVNQSELQFTTNGVLSAIKSTNNNAHREQLRDGETSSNDGG